MSVFTPPALELAARPPGLLTNPASVPKQDLLCRWVERFLCDPSKWRAMGSLRRNAFLAWLADVDDWRVVNVGRPELSRMHFEMSAEFAARTIVKYDLQAALDNPVTGAQWDWPLRLIARWHCATDVHAPVLFRVNKQFEYCWRLAVKTNEIDFKAFKDDRRRLNARIAAQSQAIERPLSSNASVTGIEEFADLQDLAISDRSVPKRDKHECPIMKQPHVLKQREVCKRAFLMQGFEVRRGTIVEAHENQVVFMGADVSRVDPW